MSDGYPRSPLVRGVVRGTVFFTLLLLFDVFWNAVVEDQGAVLTAENILFAGLFSAFFVLLMHFIDVKAGRTDE